MKLRHLLLIIVTTIGVGLGGLSPVLAQTDKEPTGFKNVTLWINPEYDDPRLLVMLQGQIVGAAAPARVRFLVPAAAEMYSAGSMDAQGKYSGGPPDRKASQVAGWDEISYQVQTDIFRMEYYDPIISGQPDKKISYDFRYLYPISDLRVIVQEPRKSANFTVSPEGATGRDGEGFVVHSYTYGNLTDSPVHFDIAYTKSDPHPSLAVDTTSTGSANIPIIVGIIAGLGAVAVLIFQVRKSRARPRPVKSSVKNVPKARKSRDRYCRECGNPVDGSYRFCPHCRSKLNKSA